MDRSEFLRRLAILPITAAAMKLGELGALAETFAPTEKMPVLFLGHGSPMNAIEENEFVQGFRSVAAGLPKPRAILCVSAHWETRGTFVTAMPNPPTIHDFGGFPKALFDVQYPAPGSPTLARETKALVKKTEVGLDDKWGLDHGAWSVIKHLYPKADVPVIQMSLDHYQNPEYHYELARELSSLRRKGILIIGSGNMVHNLGMVAWDKLNAVDYAYDWAREASEKMNRFILEGDHQSLVKFRSQGKAFDLAIPTPEHFLPLLYTLALKDEKDEVSLFNDKAVAGSLTMTSVRIG
ncbi:MAG: 4,5-DOPA dioxygenase extradiol [Bacteroidia bacterium]|jgi:4,5-DOPA dioxygenase extradiol|nr:4,5-DOPA dioxygenase extradiol [Bacteroidia bacterium]MBP7728622.1 4,5-DOPA dioxygenase extradiol [Bacteroidia bacterium]MBP7773270.1 4,5-DOPA dioxygenase extradiol [Bacteroidia bacterium]HRS37869.1 4,5-DOPA dioxygenase extradiol [Bacteroidia bacterium]HRU60807.1 4,5-DOPA dioxygenase extradiol [Bacteroidia bacterium]